MGGGERENRAGVGEARVPPVRPTATRSSATGRRSLSSQAALVTNSGALWSAPSNPVGPVSWRVLSIAPLRHEMA